MLGVPRVFLIRLDQHCCGDRRARRRDRRGAPRVSDDTREPLLASLYTSTEWRRPSFGEGQHRFTQY